jgi:glycerol-3-phosphate dehydrogenase
MKRFITSYKEKVFDLIIIGGGITGATVAYEAASRGLSVALIEKSDFGSATSSATSRMIHGGLRYLSTFEFGLVRESLRERRILMNIAPNFIHPSPFLFATYKKNKVSHITMKTAMFLYELLSYDKNRLKDKSKKMPHFKSVHSHQVIDLIPKANRKGLVGAHLYFDCSSHSPERLTLSFLKSAVKYGASVSNYTELVDFIIDEKSGVKIIKGIRVVDLLNGNKLDIKGNLVINCGGPWADIILEKAKRKSGNHDLRRSEGIHIVTKNLVDKYTFSTSTEKGKHFFLVPYRNHTLIGTTDKEYTGKPDDYKVTRKAIEELLDDVNSSFGNGEKIKYEDIVYTYGGLRPLIEDQTEDVYQSSRKYEITGEKKNGIEGLITVEGGKFTTSRTLAEKAIDKVLKILKKPNSKSKTKNEYLTGCEIDNFESFVKQKQKQYPQLQPEQIEYLVKSYGTEIDEIFTIAKENLLYQKSLNPDGENLALVVYAIRNEMALTLPDIMLRRTGLAMLGHPGKETLEKVANLAAKELLWDENKRKEEIKKMESILQIPE